MYQLFSEVRLHALIPKNLAAGCKLALFRVVELEILDLVFPARSSGARPRCLVLIALCSSGLDHGYQLLDGVALHALIPKNLAA